MENQTERYQEWSQEDLNQRIFALYQQIEKVTLQNLQVAQKNCELQVQIKTLDQILDGSPGQSSSIIRTEQSFQSKYQNLLDDHIKLTERVNQIEQLLYQSNRNRNHVARSLKNSVSKMPSCMPTHRKSNTRVDYCMDKGDVTSRHEGVRRKNSRFK